jgi:RNA polymerase sigma-70 factor (ECF subfamily)
MESVRADSPKSSIDPKSLIEPRSSIEPGSPHEVAPTSLTATDFVECYQIHYPRLVRALQLSGADRATAEDLTQEAFGRALARWRRIARGPNPPGYVYTTGFRLWQRSQARRPPAVGAPPAPSTESAAVTTVAVQNALAGMPPRRRACAVMCLVVGLPVHEAAGALGVADGTVRKHLEEARRDLRAACFPPN